MYTIHLPSSSLFETCVVLLFGGVNPLEGGGAGAQQQRGAVGVEGAGAPMESQLVMVDGMPYLGSRATADDVEKCMDQHKSNKKGINKGAVVICNTEVPLWKFHNAIADAGGQKVRDGSALHSSRGKYATHAWKLQHYATARIVHSIACMKVHTTLPPSGCDSEPQGNSVMLLCQGTS